MTDSLVSRALPRSYRTTIPAAESASWSASVMASNDVPSPPSLPPTPMIVTSGAI